MSDKKKPDEKPLSQGGTIRVPIDTSKAKDRKVAIAAFKAIKAGLLKVEDVGGEMDDTLVEGVSTDLKRLSGIEFKKKYGKDKFHMRQQISSQPIARKHFGYAPTGNMRGKWNASTSKGANPARKDNVSGVRKALANKQPTAKLHRKGGIGGAKFGQGHIQDSYELMFNVALDEFGVENLGQLNESAQRELLMVVDNMLEVRDAEGNSYGPFWEDYAKELTSTCANCFGRPGGVRGYVQPLVIHRNKMDQSDLAGCCTHCGEDIHKANVTEGRRDKVKDVSPKPINYGVASGPRKYFTGHVIDYADKKMAFGAPKPGPHKVVFGTHADDHKAAHAQLSAMATRHGYALGGLKDVQPGTPEKHHVREEFIIEDGKKRQYCWGCGASDKNEELFTHKGKKYCSVSCADKSKSHADSPSLQDKGKTLGSYRS